MRRKQTMKEEDTDTHRPMESRDNDVEDDDRYKTPALANKDLQQTKQKTKIQTTQKDRNRKQYKKREQNGISENGNDKQK